MQKTHRIEVKATASYIERQSQPESGHYFFIYQINITNCGNVAARVLERHWIIQDSDGVIQEIRGEGVVGEKPRLGPGETYRYNSSAMIATPVGTMHGEYGMEDDEGIRFEAEIPQFTLSIPRVLH